MALVRKFFTKNNKIVKFNNNFISSEIFDNEIVINFSSPPTNLVIEKAPLKYDKNFAFSYTFDDGYSSTYNIAFPIFQGLPSGSTYTSGLTYTDGCGNDQNFRVGLSIPSLNSSGSDIHINTPSILTWTQMTELLDLDWDIYNHGYHASITGGTYTDYYNEVKNNEDYIYSHTGYKPRHFVIPNGVDAYIEPAWDYGVLSQSANRYQFPRSGITNTVSRTGVTVNDVMNLYQYCMYKKYSYVPSGSSAADITIIDDIDNIANSSSGNTRLWWYQFSHGIETVTGTSEGNLNIATFNYLFNHVYNTYGKPGNDKVWFAPFQEVYDYLKVRDNTNITYSINGNSATIKLNQLTSFADLRRYQLSLNITNDNANIESIILDGYTNYSYNGTGTTSSLINLDWSNGVIELAEKYTRIAESTKTQTTIDKAQYFVNKIHISTVKAQYQTRLNNIVIPSPKILIDFGFAPVANASIYTGITFSGETNIWNQFSGFVTGTTVSSFALKNVQGTLTSSSIYIVSGFTSGGANGAQTGNDTGVYPDSRMKNQNFSTAPLISYIKVDGLNNSKSYKFIFFGSIITNTNTTNYSIGATTVSLANKDNTQNTVNITATPTNNEVIIKIASSTNAYINVLEIDEL